MFVSLGPFLERRPHTCAYSQIQNFLRVDLLAFVKLQAIDPM